MIVARDRSRISRRERTRSLNNTYARSDINHDWQKISRSVRMRKSIDLRPSTITSQWSPGPSPQGEYVQTESWVWPTQASTRVIEQVIKFGTRKINPNTTECIRDVLAAGIIVCAFVVEAKRRTDAMVLSRKENCMLARSYDLRVVASKCEKSVRLGQSYEVRGRTLYYLTA